MNTVSRHLTFVAVVSSLLFSFGATKAPAGTKQESNIDALIHRTRGKREQLAKSKLQIEFSPLVATLRPSQYKEKNGQYKTVLVLPIKVVNKSQQTIEADIAHEWGGGIWPGTDLCVSMLVGQEPAKAIEPVFLVGMEDSTKTTVLRPGESIVLNLRMDWPGTGSCPRVPLMPADKSASYDLCTILFFTREEKKEYVIGPTMRIQVIK